MQPHEHGRRDVLARPVQARGYLALRAVDRQIAHFGERRSCSSQLVGDPQIERARRRNGHLGDVSPPVHAAQDILTLRVQSHGQRSGRIAAGGRNHLEDRRRQPLVLGGEARDEPEGV
jgi:hypothetical protein